MSSVDHKWSQFHVLYQASIKGDADNKLLEEACDEIDYQKLKYPQNYTDNKNTLLHVAICGGFKEKSVIKILEKLTADTESIIREPNNVGDTILHEAAHTGMTQVAKILIDKDPELLVSKNKFGEIPLFKAVKLDHPDTFCCLAREMKKIHLNHAGTTLSRENGDTILHQAILNECFGIALKIVKWYPELVNQRNGYHLIGLQLLSSMTSAFKSGSNYGLLEELIYYFLPNQTDDDYHDDNNEFGDQNKSNNSSFYSYYEGITSTLEFVLGTSMVKRIKKEKRKHQYALKLAEYLIKEDLSWDEDDKQLDTEIEEGQTFKLPSLLIATSRGIVEIVDEILRVYPQAIEVGSSTQENILHLAIVHRQLKIFEKVRDTNISLQRLVRITDKNNNSILHLLGNPTYSKLTALPPAFHLQQELYWFELVKKITPDQYKEFKYKYKPTPWQYFERKHQNMLDSAKEWAKRTSKSCSTVAVLIASAAFAAAYTVPGGLDEIGYPILVGQLFFNIFIITDTLAIASSLTAVVMFLSILTSPFDMMDFKSSLPYKLHLGFGFLFFSVAMTMLSFVATIILIVKLKKRWLTIVVYAIAFLPVSMLALIQLPFLLMFKNVEKKVLQMIKHYIIKF